MLFSCGFIINFVLGGITGVALALVAFDVNVHDTSFFVAHFHYIVYALSFFAHVSLIYLLFRKFDGKMLN